jgi:putative aldouronate transport system substrate-binding protein
VKRILVVLLALVIAGLSFASGGQEGSGEGVRPTGGPLEKYDPPLTVSIWRSDSNRTFVEGQDIKDNIWTRAIQDELGIIFDYVWTAPNNEMNAKINTSLAAGDLPDIITKLNLEQYYNLARVERLAPQTELLNTYDVGDVRKYLDYGPGITRQMLTIKDEIYGWGRGPALANVKIFTARNDWLQNLGKEMPETIDDIIDLLYAFSEDDPDGNGEDDTYGLAAAAGFLGGGMPLEVFFACYESYPQLWVEESGKLVFGSLTSQTKEALAVLKQLHADGVMSPEWPVLGTWSEGPDEIAQGKVGAAFGQQWWHNWGGVTQTIAGNVGMEWEHVLPRRSDGQYINVPVSAQVTDINAVNKDFANPEVLVKLYNLNYRKTTDPETADGDFHTIQTDAGGVSAFFYWNDMFASHNIDINPILSLDVIEALKTKDTSRLNPEARGYYNGASTYLEGKAKLTGNDSGYGNYKSFGPGGTNALAWTMINNNLAQVDAYQGTPTSAQAKYAGDLRSTRDETFIQIIVGERDLNEGWEEWLTYWDRNGGAEWAGEVNEWKSQQ